MYAGILASSQRVDVITQKVRVNNGIASGGWHLHSKWSKHTQSDAWKRPFVSKVKDFDFLTCNPTGGLKKTVELYAFSQISRANMTQPGWKQSMLICHTQAYCT